MKKLILLLLLLVPACLSAQTVTDLSDPGSNGVVKRTALGITGVAASSDLIALWTGTCNATSSLFGDGACRGVLLSAPSGTQTITTTTSGGLSIGNVPCTSLNANSTTDAGCAAAYNAIVLQSIGVSTTNPMRHALNSYLETDLHQVTGSNEFYPGMFTMSTLLDSGSTGSATQRTIGLEVMNSTQDLASSGVTLQNQNGIKLRSSVGVNAHVTNVAGLLLYLPTLNGTITNYTGFATDANTGTGSVTNATAGDFSYQANSVVTTTAIGTKNSATQATTNYGSWHRGAQGGVLVDDTTALGSFIGHVTGTWPSFTFHDGWYSGTGSPETVVTAAIGSFFSRRDGSLGTGPLYAKTTGTGNTGWNAIPTLVGSGTATLGTSAISATTCATAVTVASTNVASTDAIQWAFNAAPGTGYTSGVNVLAYATTGNVNFLVCNPTAGSLTPAAATLNWRVDR